MKVSEILKELNHIIVEYGDIDIQLQSEPKSDEYIMNYEHFSWLLKSMSRV